MKSVEWVLESKCNLSCKHCIHKGHLDHNNLSLDEKKSVVRILKSNGIEEIIFSSLEPLLSKDVDSLLKYCRFMGMGVSITTNGLLATDKIIKELSKCKIRYIAVSLEGLSAAENDIIRGVGSFDKVIANVDKIINEFRSASKPAPMIIQICLNKYNIDEICKRLDSFFVEHDVESISFCRIHEYGGAKDYPDYCMSQEEYMHAVERIIISTKHRERLRFRDTNVFEILFLNITYNLDLQANPTMCSACTGRFSIMPDGSLCRCSLLIDKGVMENSDLNIGCSIFDFPMPEIANISKKYNVPKYGLCKYCPFLECCEVCLINIDSGHIKHDVLNSCWTYYRRVVNLFSLMISGDLEYHIRFGVSVRDYGNMVLFKYNDREIILKYDDASPKTSVSSNEIIHQPRDLWDLLKADFIRLGIKN